MLNSQCNSHPKLNIGQILPSTPPGVHLSAHARSASTASCSESKGPNAGSAGRSGICGLRAGANDYGITGLEFPRNKFSRGTVRNPKYDLSHFALAFGFQHKL